MAPPLNYRGTDTAPTPPRRRPAWQVWAGLLTGALLVKLLASLF